MARELGDARRGEDGDVGSAGLTDKKVDAKSGYFDNLRDRMGQKKKRPVAGGPEPFTIDSNMEAECAEEPAKPAFVVYGDDGKPE